MRAGLGSSIDSHSRVPVAGDLHERRSISLSGARYDAPSQRPHALRCLGGRACSRRLIHPADQQLRREQGSGAFRLGCRRRAEVSGRAARVRRDVRDSSSTRADAHRHDQIAKTIGVLEMLHAAGRSSGGLKRDHQQSASEGSASPSGSPNGIDPLQPPTKRSASRRPSRHSHFFAPSALPLATRELGSSTFAGDPTFRTPPQDHFAAFAAPDIQTHAALTHAEANASLSSMNASQLAFQNLIDPRREVDWKTAFLPSTSSAPNSNPNSPPVTNPVQSYSVGSPALQTAAPTFGNQSFTLDFNAPQDQNGFYPLLSQAVGGSSTQQQPPPPPTNGQWANARGFQPAQQQQQRPQSTFPTTPFDPSIFGNAGFDVCFRAIPSLD